MEFSSGHIGLGVSKVLFNVLFAPQMNIEIDQNSLADGRRFLDQYLPVLNSQLQQQRFIAGEDMTIADVSLVATLDPCELIDVELSPYPALVAWRNYLRTTEWYKACHNYFGEGFLPE